MEYKYLSAEIAVNELSYAVERIKEGGYFFPKYWGKVFLWIQQTAK
jgi:hypothetical protein